MDFQQGQADSFQVEGTSEVKYKLETTRSVTYAWMRMKEVGYQNFYATPKN